MSEAAPVHENGDVRGSAWKKEFLLPLKRFPISLYPTLMIGIFFLIPFGIMFVVSFATRTQSTYEAGFEFTHYARFFSPLFTTHLWVSVQFSVLASLLSIMAAVPFTYFISRFRRRPPGRGSRLHSERADSFGGDRRLFTFSRDEPVERLSQPR